MEYPNGLQWIIRIIFFWNLTILSRLNLDAFPMNPRHSIILNVSKYNKAFLKLVLTQLYIIGKIIQKLILNLITYCEYVTPSSNSYPKYFTKKFYLIIVAINFSFNVRLRLNINLFWWFSKITWKALSQFIVIYHNL